MQTLTDAQIRGNLSPCYRSLFDEVKRQKIYSHESIFYAADFTGNSSSSQSMGFLVLANQRFLAVSELVSYYGISYFKSGSTWDKVLGKNVEDRRWVDPHRAFGERYQANLERQDFDSFQYRLLKGVIRSDFTVEDKSEQIPLVELRLEFHDRFITFLKTFKAKDGKFILELLNLARENGGKLIDQSANRGMKNDDPNPDVAQQVKSLTHLRQAGILTEAEFEQKLQSILRR